MTVLAIALSYVLGSVPTGLWLGLRLRRVDIRQYGSRNIGATNTLRVLGKPLGITALVGDAGKGVAAVCLATLLSPWGHAPLACGLAAIGGHTASVFLNFKGGKGVATSAGVFLALIPIPTAIALASFTAVVAATRMVSAGSITAAAVVTAAVWAMDESLVLRLVVTIVSGVVIFRHRTNIARIIEGTESRLGKEPTPEEAKHVDSED